MDMFSVNVTCKGVFTLKVGTWIFTLKKKFLSPITSLIFNPLTFICYF